jgi:uncharacterized membrane protein YkvI
MQFPILFLIIMRKVYILLSYACLFLNVLLSTVLGLIFWQRQQHNSSYFSTKHWWWEVSSVRFEWFLAYALVCFSAFLFLCVCV